MGKLLLQLLKIEIFRGSRRVLRTLQINLSFNVRISIALNRLEFDFMTNKYICNFSKHNY